MNKVFLVRYFNENNVVDFFDYTVYENYDDAMLAVDSIEVISYFVCNIIELPFHPHKVETEYKKEAF